MCHQISPLLIAELRAALENLQVEGRPRLPRRDPSTKVPDVFPGRQLPLFVVGEDGMLDVAEPVWGFDAPAGSRSRLVFNTRIETALSQARSGSGLWAQPITQGRCLVPVRAFYESWTISPPSRGAKVRFSMPGRRVFLLAGVCAQGRCSVVTTAPNASVGAVHSRMPLVLGPGESSIWLGPDYASLADRSAILLDAREELAARTDDQTSNGS